MKKLMIALGVVALAATVQAADFRWYNSASIAAAGNSSTDVTSGTLYLFSGNGQSALFSGYLAAIAGGTSAADYLTGAFGYAGSGTLASATTFGSTTVDGARITGGRVVWSENTTDSSRDYFQVFVDGDNIYISDTISVAVKGTGNSNIAFSNDESLAAIREASAGYQSGGWYAVPEPTSGLLIVLGMAGLALKRKHT